MGVGGPSGEGSEYHDTLAPRVCSRRFMQPLHKRYESTAPQRCKGESSAAWLCWSAVSFHTSRSYRPKTGYPPSSDRGSRQTLLCRVEKTARQPQRSELQGPFFHPPRSHEIMAGLYSTFPSPQTRVGTRPGSLLQCGLLSDYRKHTSGAGLSLTLYRCPFEALAGAP